MLEHFIRDYGYLAILVGTFFEGETIVILAGIAAHQGLLTTELVALSAFIGSYAGDQVWFQLGRVYGQRWLAKRPRWKDRIARVAALLKRNDTLFILSFRFFYGLRNISPIAIALSDISWFRFFVLNGIAAALWAIIFTIGGYIFGHGLEALLGDIHAIQAIVLGIIMAVGLAIFGFYHLRRHYAERRKRKRSV
ncbi:MAG: DedA family protein [Alphaproteobacteria bacterium]